MKASETKFQSIIEGTQQYVIPLFQRAYSWEKKNGKFYGMTLYIFARTMSQRAILLDQSLPSQPYLFQKELRSTY